MAKLGFKAALKKIKAVNVLFIYRVGDADIGDIDPDLEFVFAVL